MEQTDYNAIPSEKSTTSFNLFEKVRLRFEKFLLSLKSLRSISFLIILFLVMILTFLGIRQATSNSAGMAASEQTDERVDVSKPTVQKAVNKTFTFPLKDQEGHEVSNLSYTIENVELRNQIIVKGQRATAIKGKTFLIVNIKLTNNYNQTIQVNAKDYLRIIIGDSVEKLAPDMHSDPVEVQAISTKPTRLGMPINETDKNIILQVGEITGKKEDIKISF